MSRRLLIIIILSVLILGVAGGTIVLLIQRLEGEDISLLVSPAPSQSTDAEQKALANPDGDDDGDGLTNAQEVLWGTFPDNPDSDGDGYKDGEEVAAGHDPTKPGPDDKLPDGFQPAQYQRTEVSYEPLQADQYFSSGSDMVLTSDNLSDDYKRRYKENERNPDTLAKYVEQQPIITKLPTANLDKITVQQSSGPQSLAAYIKAVDNISILRNNTLLIEGLNQLYQHNNPAAMNGWRLQVQFYKEDLLKQSVPPEAMDLHKVLLGYSQLLESTLSTIAEWNTDSVKAMTALRQLNTNDRVFYPIIQREINRLRGTVK